MPQKSTGWTNSDGQHVPYVTDPSGQVRLLTRLPTPEKHPVRAMPGYAESGHPVIPLQEMKPFSRVHAVVPILNQGQYGACLPHAWSTAMMIARNASGAPFVKLSPWFLYSLINGGRDAGSNAGDAIQVLTFTGTCPDSLLPYGTIRTDAVTRTRLAPQAARFRLAGGEAVRIKSFEEAVSAAYHGWGVCLDVKASPGFDVDRNGVATFNAGWTDHEVFGGEEFKILPGGQPVLGGRNSWSEQWGVKGRCYWTERHLENSQETYAVRFAVADPQDALPPAL